MISNDDETKQEKPESETQRKLINELEQCNERQILKHLSLLGENIDFSYIKTCLFDNCSDVNGIPAIFSAIAHDNTEGTLTRIFLTVLNRLFQKSPEGVVDLLMVSDLSNSTICHEIFKMQNEAVNNSFVDLLSRLALEHLEKV